MKETQVMFTAPLRVELQDTEAGEPGPGQVLVRTRHSLISTGTELTILRGRHTPGSAWDQYGQYPWPAGYCNVGSVAAVGPGVEGLKPGARVASEGPHASAFVRAAADLRPIPDGVSDDEAMLSTIAEIVMQGVRLSTIRLGEVAVVCGLGLLGQLTVAFARFSGAWPVVGVDVLPLRRRMASAHGADAVVEPSAALEAVRDLTDGRMADVGFEVTGNPDAIAQQVAWLRRLGRLVIVSSPRGPSTFDFHDLCNARGTVIIGAHNFTHPAVPNEYYRWSRHDDACLYLRLVDANKMHMADLITHRFAVARAAEAYGVLMASPGEALAVALDWPD
jgi:2-desacetyl-2-hydroxyethyl bacteriochlorophyllide A dehydrogenase